MTPPYLYDEAKHCKTCGTFLADPDTIHPERIQPCPMGCGDLLDAAVGLVKALLRNAAVKR